MPVVVLIVDALGVAAGYLVAVIASMGTIRVLLLAWRLIRLIQENRASRA